ncbi:MULTISPECIES: division/outer membrane stress-associated lipid-binding lipoprotein [unclassified Avibacterium]|uniref:division/outer membrane stress-associated lipid-binding lipoprotein n=1 Tax=unclassified Avibacterium TaxID=2685287 RepID=UPI0020266E31|nr:MULTISPECIES: division/outer membrane stress-associated lipid-binding lipoprotein [unclassified Avibacterium]MCW9697892.1 divisome-associated lipoprotein YraP [Avibacterium sp. 20-129]MCW9734119.1 divisome-associated lipoprotein YraP [Avibacterium sp. 20-15]URL03763.1 divisome-associated lipoprotein YraP [Avibacterium sp. 20-132]
MKTRNLKKLALILGSAFLLQGCVSATVAGIVGATAVATKVATDPRTVGTQVDDETLEEKVLHAINKDQQLDSEARINVVSYGGRILLIGQVPNENLKEIATGLAKGVDNVSEVYNELRVGSPISLGQISQDSWITTQIKSKLFVNSGVKATDVKVITENGEVFLMGNLTQQQADAATEIARNVAGVVKVIKVFKYLN